jgi:hypothetical protein
MDRIPKLDEETKELNKQSMIHNMGGYGETDILVIGAFNICMLVNDKWEVLTTYNLTDWIPLYEYDEGMHIIDTNQDVINKYIKDIIDEIRETGTLLPVSYENDKAIVESFYITDKMSAVLKVVGIISEETVYSEI